MRKIFISSSTKTDDNQKVPYIDNVSFEIPEDIEEFEEIEDDLVDGFSNYGYSNEHYSYLKVENDAKSLYFLIEEQDNSGMEYGGWISIYVSEDKEYVLEHAIATYENEHNRPDSKNKCPKCKKHKDNYCELKMLKSLKKYKKTYLYEENYSMQLFKYKL